MQALTLRPDLYNRDCGECRKKWYDDEGKPIIKNGVHLDRPGPPACHRCKKKQLDIEVLTDRNQALFDAYTDRVTFGVSGEWTESELAVMRQIHLALEKARRKRLAFDLAEVLHGRS